MSLPIAVDGPFTADLTTVELGGGDTVELVLHFAPELAGAAHGTLHVGDLVVSLDGEGLTPLACDPDTDCHHRVFDPLTGVCVDQLLVDGSACAGDACLENGRCLAGQCVGTSKSCDDHNACTRDSCSPTTGCEHTDASAQCQALDACHAPVCDPATGCSTVPVADGTACGEVSCVLANVCMQGRCVAVTPPDGFVCEPQSPCQDRGTCQAQQCVRPSPRVLSPAWSYEPPQDDLILFEGVSDPLGNFWWVECATPGQTSTCRAVSYTKDGFERFRGGAVSGIVYTSGAQLFDEGRFVFAMSNGVVVALDGATGAELWRADVLAALNSPLTSIWELQLTSDGHGHLWASNANNLLWCGDVQTISSLVELDSSTGALRTTMPFDIWGSPVADEQGALFVTHATYPVEVSSFSPQGVGLFNAPADGGTELIAAGQGRLVMESNRVFASGNGVELSPWDPRNLLQSSAVQVGGQTIRVRRTITPWSYPIGIPPIMPFTELVLYDATNPMGRTLASVAGPQDEVTIPVMAQHDTVLVAGRLQPWPQPATLKGVTTAGVERFSCQLEELLGFDGAGLHAKVGFTGDRLATVYTPLCRGCLRGPSDVIRVFDTTGLGVASSGWVSARGTPGNAGHPR